TDPPGAEVQIRDYLKPESNWVYIGRTPIQQARLPFLFMSLRITKPGYADVEWALRPLPIPPIKLTPNESAPPGIVYVLGTGRPDQRVPGDNFWLDRFETTNTEYKKFVDAGGYQDRKYWKEPFRDGDKEISWEEARKRFRDATGRPGPANWELGTYPE